MPFLINDTIVYDCDADNSALEDGICFIPSLSLIDIAKEMNIEIEGIYLDEANPKEYSEFIENDKGFEMPEGTQDQRLLKQFFFDIRMKDGFKKQAANIVEQIIESLSNNKLVIICVDCFYEPIREDTYRKEHAPHTLLVYDYNKKEKNFLVLEQSYSDSLNYKERAIGFEHISNCYRGFIENFANQENLYTYFEVNKVEKGDVNKAGASYMSFYYQNMMHHKDMINDSLEKLELLTQKLENMVRDERALANNAEELVKLLNAIVKAKQVERFKLLKLFGNDSVPYKLINAVVENWDNIRNYIVKFMFTSMFDNKKANSVSSILYELVNNERMLCEELHHLIKTDA